MIPGRHKAAKRGMAPRLTGTTERCERALRSMGVFPNLETVLQAALRLHGGLPTRTTRECRAGEDGRFPPSMVEHSSNNLCDDGDFEGIYHRRVDGQPDNC